MPKSWSITAEFEDCENQQVGYTSLGLLAMVLKEFVMGHALHIQSKEQYIQALGVLNHVKGWWRGIGPSSAPVLLLTDEQYQALVDAGVVTPNGKEVKPGGKKTPAKKTKS